MKHQSAVYHDTYYSFNLSTKEETQVVVRFWIITIVLVLLGLSTLKLR